MIREDTTTRQALAMLSLLHREGILTLPNTDGESRADETALKALVVAGPSGSIRLESAKTMESGR
jgi:hypothetical protein